jgi:DNA-binding response OmpR family regulator
MTTRKSVILVVDGDAWVHRAMAAVVSSDEFDVVPCTSARGALNACCAIDPACVVAELELSDESGIWLAAAIRQEPGSVNAVPIVLTSSRTDQDAHLSALRGGADVLVPKPIRVLELVAQVKALVAMAARLRGDRGSILPPSSIDGRPRAMIGDLDRMSVATVLGALELDRRSGELVLRGSTRDRKLTLELAGGTLVGGRRGNALLRPVEALRVALAWDGRRFEFVPGPDHATPVGADSFGNMILTAIRMNEAEAAEKDAALRAALDAASSAELPGALPSRTASGFAPSHQSGTRRKVTPLDAVSPKSPPPLARPTAPGSRLVESMAPLARPDPRAEQEGDGTTLKLGGKRF